MDATIVDEDEMQVGVEIVDNAGVDHELAVGFDGEIRRHSQTGYGDPDERTSEADEYVRRFARYHVFRERGYPTRALRTIPEWVAVVATTVAVLPPQAFETHFGAYSQQIRSTVDDGVEPVVTIPEVAVIGSTVYRLAVHTELDAVEILERGQDAFVRALEESTDWPQLVRALSIAVGGTAEPGSAHRLSVSGVSDIGVRYQGHTRTVGGDADDPNPGPPDARLELSPAHTPWERYRSIDRGFQLLVVHHLLCQARDRYLEMGLEPPVGLRLLGPGTVRQTVRTERLELYGPVHSLDASVEGYRFPDVETGLER